MRLFAPNKEHEVQAFMRNLLNNNCAKLEALDEGPRTENRVRLTVVVMVIPTSDGKPVLERAFAAVTKEFCSTGVSLVLDEPKGVDDVILAFRWEMEMKFVRAKAKHLSPMGAGFYMLGFRVTEMVCVGDFLELESVHL